MFGSTAAVQLPSVGIPSRVEPCAVGVVPTKTSTGFRYFFQGGPRSSWGWGKVP